VSALSRLRDRYRESRAFRLAVDAMVVGLLFVLIAMIHMTPSWAWIKSLLGDDGLALP
jgi:uncharacterized membrane protein